MCVNKCIASVLLSTNSCERFSDFLEILSKRIRSHKDIYVQDFYNSLHRDKILKCEIGRFYTEKYIFVTFHRYLFVSGNEHRNRFINNKLVLYSWLEPRHLDITFGIENPFIELCNELNFLSKIDDIIWVFIQIRELKTPTELLSVFLKTISSIYEVIGHGASHDVLFPTLVYVIISSQVRNISIIFEYLTKYSCSLYVSCSGDCTHLTRLRPELVCDCVCEIKYDKEEINYYLTILQAAIVFIERIEYNSINITKQEYDANILHSVSKIEMKYNEGVPQNRETKIRNIFNYINKYLH